MFNVCNVCTYKHGVYVCMCIYKKCTYTYTVESCFMRWLGYCIYMCTQGCTNSGRLHFFGLVPDISGTSV